MLNIITTMFDHIVNTTTYLFVYGNQCGNVLKKNIQHITSTSPSNVTIDKKDFFKKDDMTLDSHIYYVTFTNI